MSSSSKLNQQASSSWSLADDAERKTLLTRGNLEGAGRVLLFHAREMRALAEVIAASSGGRIVLGSVEWRRFPDSFPNLKIRDAHCIRWAHVAFLASMHSPEVIFEQMSLICALPRYLAKSVRVVLPFFPTGTMERVQEYGEVATAKTLARLLSHVPMCASGIPQVIIFDIHTLQNEFYFDDTVLVRHTSCVPLLKRELSLLAEKKLDSDDEESDKDKGQTTVARVADLADMPIAVAFPDEGAYKRFHAHFDKLYELIICHKVRDGDKRIVKLKEGDVKDKHCVIVDDLVQSGSTLLQCAKTLLANGAGAVSAYVTHAIFPNESHEKFVGNSDFQFFWVTNSHPVTRKLVDKPPFKILSVAPLVIDEILDLP